MKRITTVVMGVALGLALAFTSACFSRPDSGQISNCFVNAPTPEAAQACLP